MPSYPLKRELQRKRLSLKMTERNMNKQKDREILVYADWLGEEPQLIGVLSSSILRGKEIFAFEYSSQWLNNIDIRALDPSLHLFEGRQFAPQGQSESDNTQSLELVKSVAPYFTPIKAIDFISF